MRALLIPEVGEAVVGAYRSTAFTVDLGRWADVVVGFQPSHLARIAEYADDARLCTSIGRWLPDDVEWIKDPHFDSTGARHIETVRLLQLALPAMYAEVVG